MNARSFCIPQNLTRLVATVRSPSGAAARENACEIPRTLRSTCLVVRSPTRRIKGPMPESVDDHSSVEGSMGPMDWIARGWRWVSKGAARTWRGTRTSARIEDIADYIIILSGSLVEARNSWYMEEWVEARSMVELTVRSGSSGEVVKRRAVGPEVAAARVCSRSWKKDDETRVQLPK